MVTLQAMPMAIEWQAYEDQAVVSLENKVSWAGGEFKKFRLY